MYKYLLLVCVLLLSGTSVMAQDNVFYPYQSAQQEPLIISLSDDDIFQIASADNNSRISSASAANSSASITEEPDTPYKKRLFTLNKTHQYLGIGSIALAGLTMLAPKKEGGAHEYLAEGAAALGAAAVISGIAAHYEDINLSNGFKDPDNMHIALTSLGALGFLLAIDEAPKGGHAGPGAIGTISMALGIKLIW